MEIFEWIIWIILAVFTLTSFITWKIKERGYKKGSFYDTREVVALITVPRFVIASSILLIIFLFINVNKFHLIWIYPAMYILILLRISKRVVKADEKRNEMSFEDTLRDAQNGDAIAQFALGNMYFVGKVVPRERDEAKKWLTKAANQNHIDAQFELSKMYLYEEDDKNALEWTQRAAAQGHPDAQYAMSVVYSGGVVIPQDFVQALMWCILSADQGHKEAAVDLDLIAKNMTPAQIENSQNLAKKWKLKIKNSDNSNVPNLATARDGA